MKNLNKVAAVLVVLAITLSSVLAQQDNKNAPKNDKPKAVVRDKNDNQQNQDQNQKDKDDKNQKRDRDDKKPQKE